ncbi:hypothetical protein ACFL6O_05145 [candidate division KSB1 bacterium]
MKIAMNPKSAKLLTIINNEGEAVKEFGELKQYENFNLNQYSSYFEEDTHDNIFVTYQFRNCIEKYSPDGELLLKIDRQKEFDENENFESKQKTVNGKIRNIRTFNWFSTGIGIDNKGRLWVGSLKRQLTEKEQVEKIYPDIYMFEIFDENGVLLSHVDLPDYRAWQGIRISRNKVFIIDTNNLMTVTIYNILDN